MLFSHILYSYQIIAASCYLDIALRHIVILIILRLIGAALIYTIDCNVLTLYEFYTV